MRNRSWALYALRSMDPLRLPPTCGGVARAGVGDTIAAVLVAGALLWGCGTGWLSSGAARADEPPPVFLEGAEREAFLVRVGEELSASRSVDIDFIQRKEIRLFKESARSDGTILFESPSRLRWEIREPFQSLLVVDGERVAKFEVVDGRRRELQLAGSREALALVMGRIQAWLRGGFGDEDPAFLVEARARPVPSITLTPRAAGIEERIRSITLVLHEDLGALERLVLEEPDGGRTVLELTVRARNIAFPTRTFSTTDPLPLAEVRASAQPEGP